MLTRADLEKRELLTLAPWAAHSADSRGRAYPIAAHHYRTDFQRDRDRVIHSRAFRRLEYKTQVFIPHERDHFRNRLTHTLEVAQISRTLARSLALNEDLAEAIALAHDLGHPPFGHAGEDTLNDILQNRGGFNHNAQCLRVIELLEDRYPDYPGLNLTYEVREGIARHETSSPCLHKDFEERLLPTLEASLVDIADEIAYNAHDIDDGLASKILAVEDIESSDWWSELSTVKMGGSNGGKGEFRRYALVRLLVDHMATDVMKETNRRIVTNGIDSLDDVRYSPEKLVGYSPHMGSVARELKQFLAARLYRHEAQITMRNHANDVVRAVFSHLVNNADALPARFQSRIATESVHVVVADYVSGMTDRFAEAMYAELTGSE